jgi:hypothetical protein
MFLKAVVLFLTYIVFAFLASAALFIRAVAIVKTVVLIIFTVRVKGFRRLLRLISVT